jgi:hypothetical protein
MVALESPGISKPQATQVVVGHVSNTPASAGSPLFVTAPSIGVGQLIGPCEWNGQGEALPSPGQECLLAFDERGNPWVVAVASAYRGGYAGTYSASMTYQAGAVVTYLGGAWVSQINANTGNTPGASTSISLTPLTEVAQPSSLTALNGYQVGGFSAAGWKPPAFSTLGGFYYNVAASSRAPFYTVELNKLSVTENRFISFFLSAKPNASIGPLEGYEARIAEEAGAKWRIGLYRLIGGNLELLTQLSGMTAVAGTRFGFGFANGTLTVSRKEGVSFVPILATRDFTFMGSTFMYGIYGTGNTARLLGLEAVGEAWAPLAAPGAWQPLTLNANFANYGGGFANTGVRNEGGYARLRGIVKTTAEVTSGTAICTMPSSAVPAVNQALGALYIVGGTTDAAYFVRVMTSGLLEVATPANLATNSDILLDGLTYPLNV